MARGAPASGPDRAPLGCQHLPARCGRGTGGRSDAGGRRLGVLRAPRHALERRDGAYVRHEHTGRSQAPAFRLAVRPERGSWPRPGRTVPGCHGRTDRAARRYTGGDRRARARPRAGQRHAYVLVRKAPGLAGHAGDGLGHVPRPVRGPGGRGLVGAARVRQRVRARPGRRREHPDRPGSVPLQGLVCDHGGCLGQLQSQFRRRRWPGWRTGRRWRTRFGDRRNPARRAGARARAGPSGPADPGGATGRRPVRPGVARPQSGQIDAQRRSSDLGGREPPLRRRVQGVAAGLAGGGGSTLLRMAGPGRVGIQSMSKFHKTE